jgi:F-type H+-transporting ATPase subunit b
MTGEFTKIIVVAQAEGGDALQEGLLVEDEAAEGAEHAVENALGEAHAGEEAHEGEVGHESTVFPPFNPDTFASQLLWLAITFAALYFLISRVAIPQIGGILESRRTRIEGDLKEAERLRVETERAAAAYEAALAEARTNAHAIAEETRQGIRTDIEGKRAKVESDLAAKVAEAEAGIAATKSAALANVDQIAAETAAALVAQLSGPVSDAEVRDAVASVAKG